jgi:hypothetical protein
MMIQVFDRSFILSWNAALLGIRLQTTSRSFQREAELSDGELAASI